MTPVLGAGGRRRRRAPELPLGSLSQARPASPGPDLCPDCGSTCLTRLSLPNAAGVAATFVSCHDCERTGWFASADGREVSRSTVLGVDPDGDALARGK